MFECMMHVSTTEHTLLRPLVQCGLYCTTTTLYIGTAQYSLLHSTGCYQHLSSAPLTLTFILHIPPSHSHLPTCSTHKLTHRTFKYCCFYSLALPPPPLPPPPSPAKSKSTSPSPRDITTSPHHHTRSDRGKSSSCSLCYQPTN